MDFYQHPKKSNTKDDTVITRGFREQNYSNSIDDCFKETVITSFPCPINDRFTEPEEEEDDGWDSS